MLDRDYLLVFGMVTSGLETSYCQAYTRRCVYAIYTTENGKQEFGV